MESLGTAVGQQLRRSDVVGLSGPLGAGKTTFTRGLAIGLGVREAVASPTFVIARRSAGEIADLLHCDAYRLGSPDEFLDLDLDTHSAVTVIEWGQEVVPLLSDSWLALTIDRGQGQSDDVRWVQISAVGPDWRETRVQALLAVVSFAAEGLP